MSNPKHRIVILGGGFGGLHTAIELHKRRARLKTHEIVLVDRFNEHVYTPLLYEVGTGLTRPDEACDIHSLHSAVSVSLSHYDAVLRKCCFQFVRGEAVKIHADAQEVELKDGRRLPYGDVVVAVGSVANTYGIPGAAEFAHMHKTLPDVMRIHARVCEIVGELEAGARPHVKILIAGAGPTGVELASELASYLRRLEKDKRIAHGSWSVRLLTSDKDVLPMFRAKVRQLASDRLAKVGVDVHADAKVVSVAAQELKVKDADGEEQAMAFDLFVWTAGVKPFPGLGAMGVPTDAKGFASIGVDFRVKGHENAFALGDVAGFVSAKTGARVPLMAQVASAEASIVAENIVRRLERRPLISWTPPDFWIAAVPIGGPWAIADFGKFALSGRLGFWVRKAADLKYFLSVMPWRDALRVWKRGSEAFAQND